ncbi:MAG: hypothetical protein PVF51_08805 [Nitrospirota bacterium]
MADLKIRVFQGSDTAPETTVTVPGTVLWIACQLIPKRAAEALQEKAHRTGGDHQALREP